MRRGQRTPTTCIAGQEMEIGDTPAWCHDCRDPSGTFLNSDPHQYKTYLKCDTASCCIKTVSGISQSQAEGTRDTMLINHGHDKCNLVPLGSCCCVISL